MKFGKITLNMYLSGQKIFYQHMLEKVTNALLMHEMVVNLIKHMITALKHLSKWFYKCKRTKMTIFSFFAKKYLSGQNFSTKFFTS